MWEVGYDAPLSESVRWEMLLLEFGVDRLHMIPVSGIAAPWGNRPWLTEYQNHDELLAANTDKTLVFVDERAETPLQDFQHPENALYIFGRTSWSALENLIQDYLSVRIDTINPGCMWGHQACAIVLHDRGLKLCQ